MSYGKNPNPYRIPTAKLQPFLTAHAANICSWQERRGAGNEGNYYARWRVKMNRLPSHGPADVDSARPSARGVSPAEAGFVRSFCPPSSIRWTALALLTWVPPHKCPVTLRIIRQPPGQAVGFESTQMTTLVLGPSHAATQHIVSTPSAVDLD